MVFNDLLTVFRAWKLWWADSKEQKLWFKIERCSR